MGEATSSGLHCPGKGQFHLDQVYRKSTLLTKNGICGECEKFAHVQLLTLSCVCL